MKPLNEKVHPDNAFHGRHEGILLPKVMETKRVALFGDGSLGSLVAWFLVRAGLWTLEHYDNDCVALPNISRTIYRNRDVGRSKVDALNDILREINPEVVLEGHSKDIHELRDDELVSIIQRNDLVIAATDDPPTQSRVAALSYWRKPALLPGVYEKATGGEVLFTIPNETACWHCVFSGIRTEDEPNRGETDYGVPTGQLRAVPALGADIATIAVACARLAVALLHLGSGLPLEHQLRRDKNILFLGNTIDWAFTDHSENFWAIPTRRAECPVCAPSKAPAA